MDFTVEACYNPFMAQSCNRNPVVKTIRIVMSLTVIALGIYYKSWLGLLGILTLISAFQGGCPLSVNLNPRQNRFGRRIGEEDDQ